ncbi:MAG: VCBS repeat-containing protein [Deltaproteobacteria bacterium]|nr:VCBS repeat-containing protein [Deltaproteobacteria bacterium]
MKRGSYYVDGCLISQPRCANYPNYAGTFADNYDGSSSNAARCAQRAEDYAHWCGNGPDDQTIALYANGGTLEKRREDRLSGCVIRQTTCANHPTAVGTFYDNYDHAGSSHARCLRRARDYALWCGNPQGSRTSATFYAARSSDVGVAQYVVGVSDSAVRLRGALNEIRANRFIGWCAATNGSSVDLNVRAVVYEGPTYYKSFPMNTSRPDVRATLEATLTAETGTPVSLPSDVLGFDFKLPYVGRWEIRCEQQGGSLSLRETQLSPVVAGIAQVGNRAQAIVSAGLPQGSALDWHGLNEVGDTVSAAIGDFNGDGRLDVARVDPLDRISYSMTGITKSWKPIAGALRLLAAGDFNGDGRDDLAGINASGRIYYTTNLTNWTNIPGGLAQLAVGDFNGDGRDDLAGINASGRIYYTTNLTNWTNIPGGLAQLAVGDFNGDGRDDLAGINASGGIYYTTNLTNWTNIPGGLVQLAAGDLNGDGRDDLAGVNGAGSVFYSLDLVGWTHTAAAEPMKSVTLADVDGNGMADLVALGRVPLQGMFSGGNVLFTLDRTNWQRSTLYGPNQIDEFIIIRR